jgi:hypothetical protein
VPLSIDTLKPNWSIACRSSGSSSCEGMRVLLPVEGNVVATPHESPEPFE